MDFVVKSEYAGKTVKEFLRPNINLSRNMLILLKNKSDGIMVNGKRATVRYMLSDGDILSLNYEDADEINRDKNSVAENQNLLHLLDIIYEDGFILAVNKPPGMPSHPSLNHFDDTLANIVVAHFRNNNISSFYRAVNRLDRNTSGVVLIAKDKITSARLNGMMKQGDIRKTYIAALTGNVNDIYPDGGRIIAPIRRERGSIIKRITAPDGDYAETEFKVLKYNDKASVVEVYPITGRTHQIRVHFQHIGFPLLGEDLYCGAARGDTAPRKIDRHALHAYSLGFDHPRSNKKMLIKCELPEDMASIINKI
jgi:23S rRNA pseudouridine1911/1915/1917 synthase